MLSHKTLVVLAFAVNTLKTKVAAYTAEQVEKDMESGYRLHAAAAKVGNKIVIVDTMCSDQMIGVLAALAYKMPKDSAFTKEDVEEALREVKGKK